MLADIQYHRRSGNWDFLLRSQLSLLITWIKRDEVDALTAETISVAEAEELRLAGFRLIPDDMVVGIGPARRVVKILRIEKS